MGGGKGKCMVGSTLTQKKRMMFRLRRWGGGVGGGDAWPFVFFTHSFSEPKPKTLRRGAPAALRPPWRPSVPVLNHRRFLEWRKR